MQKRDKASILAQRQELALRKEMRASSLPPSDTHLRLGRLVLEPQSFKCAYDTLKPHHNKGLIALKNIGNLALTVFDSAQPHTKLRNDSLMSFVEVEDLLHERCPGLFIETSAQVKDVQLFGGVHPFIGVVFHDGPLHEELAKAAALLTRKLSKQPSTMRPHVSLARLYSTDRARQLKSELAAALPEEVRFAPASIIFERRSTG